MQGFKRRAWVLAMSICLASAPLTAFAAADGGNADDEAPLVAGTPYSETTNSGEAADAEPTDEGAKSADSENAEKTSRAADADAKADDGTDAGADAGADADADGDADGDADAGADAATDTDGSDDASTDAALTSEQKEMQVQAEKKAREEAQQQIIDEIEANKRAAEEKAERERKEAERKEKEKVNKTLSYSRKLIDKIGTQAKTGHTICCPSFSCAYGDAVLDGTYHDHSYYTCYSCTWPDWGGGASCNRCVGSSEELLREAYDQIAQGKPTVIHVTAGTGEHWICLIGYKNAKDPDHLTLGNFVALDPWDGAEIVAGDRFSLYGDGCEHVSSR